MRHGDNKCYRRVECSRLHPYTFLFIRGGVRNFLRFQSFWRSRLSVLYLNGWMPLWMSSSRFQNIYCTAHRGFLWIHDFEIWQEMKCKSSLLGCFPSEVMRITCLWCRWKNKQKNKKEQLCQTVNYRSSHIAIWAQTELKEKKPWRRSKVLRYLSASRGMMGS